MCDNCDYENLLEAAGLDATRNRIDVLEVIGVNIYPLSAMDIYRTIERSHVINRVTVYRILYLLVEKKLWSGSVPEAGRLILAWHQTSTMLPTPIFTVPAAVRWIA